MRALATRTLAGLALGLAAVGSAQATTAFGVSPIRPPIGAARCAAQQLRATYAFVPGSNATGHVEYTLTVTNRTAGATCTVSAPLQLTLLGNHGQSLPTHATSSPPGTQTVVLAPGQWAQAVSELSPDLAGPGEPTRRNCEPVAHALRITIGAASLRAPMDPTPVCERGMIGFDRLAAIAPTPRCAAGSLRATFKRDSPPSEGMAPYNLTLRSKLAHACHTDSVVGLRLLGPGAGKLATKVHAGVSAPYVFGPHALETALALLSTRGGSCGRLATRLVITPSRGSGALTSAIRPPLRVCRGGLIVLSSLFRNG